MDRPEPRYVYYRKLFPRRYNQIFYFTFIIPYRRHTTAKDECQTPRKDSTIVNIG